MKSNSFPVFLITVSFCVFFTSCLTNRQLTYLQSESKSKDLDVILSDTFSLIPPTDYKIQAFDNLYIRVMTPDPQWAEMFNTMPANSGVTMSAQGANLISYSVSADGTIDLPYLGNFEVGGKTLGTIKPELEEAFQAYISDAAITIRLINNYVSLLGEVQAPGKYPIYKDQLTIFQALALAGDLTEFSNRHKVQIIRQTQTGRIVTSIDLNDRSILDSDYYYIMPNDIIYAEPIRSKFYRMTTFSYTLILSMITTFILVLNYLD